MRNFFTLKFVGLKLIGMHILSADTTTYYFILLLRNGPQLLCTQMLSTHDPMMRGSLDFPNLIKINGITGSFKLTLEIYSMVRAHFKMFSVILVIRTNIN